MVLLSDSCKDEIVSETLDEIRVLFFHHDVESPSLFAVKQLCENLCPSCRPVNSLNESKSLS